MPIYEYQCKSCGHELEAFQKIDDQPLVECPICHKESLAKLVSATSFQLKGTGWYVTDFRDKGKPKPKEAENSGSEGNGSGEGKSDKSAVDATKETQTKAGQEKDAKSKETKSADSTSSKNSSAE